MYAQTVLGTYNGLKKNKNKMSCLGDFPEHPLRTYPPNLDLLPQLKMIAGITQLQTSKVNP